MCEVAFFIFFLFSCIVTDVLKRPGVTGMVTIRHSVLVLLRLQQDTNEAICNTEH